MDENPTPPAPAAALRPAPVARPATTLVAGAPKPPAQVQPVEQVAPAAAPAVEPANQVTVKPIRSFQGEEGFKNPQSAPFVVSRQRAADLFAVGLVEYVEASDEDAAITAAADAEVEAVKAAANARRSRK
jgi:hypothetical protein